MSVRCFRPPFSSVSLVEGRPHEIFTPLVLKSNGYSSANDPNALGSFISAQDAGSLSVKFAWFWYVQSDSAVRLRITKFRLVEKDQVKYLGEFEAVTKTAWHC